MKKYSNATMLMLGISFFSVITGSEELSWWERLKQQYETAKESAYEAGISAALTGAGAYQTLREKAQKAADIAHRGREALKSGYKTGADIAETARMGYQYYVEPTVKEQLRKIITDPEEQQRIRAEQARHQREMVGHELNTTFKNAFAQSLQDELGRLSTSQRIQPQKNPFEFIRINNALTNTANIFTTLLNNPTTQEQLSPLARHTLSDKKWVLEKIERDITKHAQQTQDRITGDDTLWQGLDAFFRGANNIIDAAITALLENNNR